MKPQFKEIIITSSLHENSPLVDNILAYNNAQSAPARVTLIEDEKQWLKENHDERGDVFSHRDTLLVYPFKGKFIHSCPGSDGMTCCNYFVINFGVNCLFDCHYCYLQTFLNMPAITFFGNFDDLTAELDRKLKNQSVRFRVGTGEYTDSLILDQMTGLSALLIENFARRENALLELKTKSVNIDHLLDLDHNGNTVMAWSLNPDFVVNTIEDHTASLKERLEAAQRAARAGFKTAFHFDPMVYYENWESDYRQVVEMLFDHVPPDSVAWISLGTFRYSPGLKEIIQRRFEDDLLTRPEMVRCSDGKMRYLRDIRQTMYSKIRGWINDVDPSLFSYLCMETKPVWDEVYNFTPSSRKNLDTYFEDRRQYIEKKAVKL